MDRRPRKVKTIPQVINGWLADNIFELIAFLIAVLLFREWAIPLIIVGIPVLIGWSLIKNAYRPE